MSSIRPQQTEKSSISTSSFTNTRANELAEPETQLTRWQSFKRHIWNSSDRTFLARTARSWLFLLLFYPIFIGVISGVFVSIIYAFRGIEERFYDLPLRNRTAIFAFKYI